MDKGKYIQKKSSKSNACMQKALLKVKDVQKTLRKRNFNAKEGREGRKYMQKRIYEGKISGKKASMKEKMFATKEGLVKGNSMQRRLNEGKKTCKDGSA